MSTRIWFDTEFIEDGHTIDLISIGMVREDGHYLYLENNECDVKRASDWVRFNVFPRLEGGIAEMSRTEIAIAVHRFAGEKPEFWGYYADYDWVALCQLYGTMMALPKGWPMFCLDIKQECMRLGNPRLPEQGKGEHNALADARWNKSAWEFLRATPSTPAWRDIARIADRSHQYEAIYEILWQEYPSRDGTKNSRVATAILDALKSLPAAPVADGET